jgi:hypothetical protein
MLEPSEEVLERICNAHWNGQNIDGVIFLDKYCHDAINYTLSGTVEVEGTIYGFIIDDGNWNGTVVRAWGDPEDVGVYTPPVKEHLTFVPSDPYVSDFGLKKYLNVRRQDWFKKLEGEMNYDLHFSPTRKIEKHYSDLAKKKGLRIGLISNQEPRVRDAIQRAEKRKRQ